MHDAVALERKGCPTAVIVTDAFFDDVCRQRVALGTPTLTPVVIAHPLSTLTNAAIQARALEALPQLKRVLISGPSG